MKHLLFVLFLSAMFLSGMTQEAAPYKVLLNEISGSYKGGCRDGLAEGKGNAEGEDRYSGEFKAGLPDGKGKYTYKNGNVYNGYFSKGLKNGKGKFVVTEGGMNQTVTGYWKDGEYAGPEDPEADYRITNQSGLNNVVIRKVNATDNKVTVTMVNGGMQTYVPRDLRIHNSSGFLKQEIKNFSVTMFNLPLTVEIHFTIRMGESDKECFLFFDILKAGSYDVVITNN